MKLFIEVKNEMHDASGIEKPQNYYWQKDSNGVYYPTRELSEDEKHEEVRNFIDENNLPTSSLDEIKLDKFNKSQMQYRDFFLSMF